MKKPEKIMKIILAVMAVIYILLAIRYITARTDYIGGFIAAITAILLAILSYNSEKIYVRKPKKKKK